MVLAPDSENKAYEPQAWLLSLVFSSQRAQAALQAVNALHGGGMASMAISAEAASIGGATAQSPVLRVIVENLFYPVTLDVLHQVRQELQLSQDSFCVSAYTDLINRFPFSSDFLQVRHSAEDHHFHQEQPVSGSDPVRRWHDSSARQTGKTGTTDALSVFLQWVMCRLSKRLLWAVTPLMHSCCLVSVSGRAEHLQRLLYPEDQLLQAHQP